ncbi:lipid storage droplets surface-binding protein 2-like [Cotesia typhae]|uniref:lipid storage droplets surface-binding protein 2-like n=1 Tax=Cotesia typhae TaxID=2053667 RepID=UPI003D69B12F
MKKETVQKSQLPQIEVFYRVIGLPVIDLVLMKSLYTYSRVKDSHQFIQWILSAVESSITIATRHTIPFAMPFARRLKSPTYYFDHTLCIDLDKIEEKIPIITESLEKIYDKGYMLALRTVQPTVSMISYANDLIISQATSLTNHSWNKTNRILSTYYGTKVTQKLDDTAIVIDKFIDKFFPALNYTEKAIEPTSSKEDQLLQTLQTIGRLSNKAAHRIYAHLMLNFGRMNRENIKIYVSNVIEFLHVTQYLHSINELLIRPKKITEKKDIQNSDGHTKHD